MTTTINQAAVLTAFPFVAVMNDINRRCKYLPAASREETASAALLAAHGRWERQPLKSWTIGMLSSGGMLDVKKTAIRSAGRNTPDSETVELLAVARTDSDSLGLDDLLRGLSDRDRTIALAWSQSKPDTEAAQLANCSVRTVCTVRVQLRERLARRL